jgi:aminopeptidase YwaD
MRPLLRLFSIALVFSVVFTSGDPKAAAANAAPTVCLKCIQDNLKTLASDDMKGRGSGTEDEHAAANFVASKLEEYGAQPAGDNGDYLQAAIVLRRKATGPPTLVAGNVTLVYGKDFVISRLSAEKFSGPLRKLSAEDPNAQLAAGDVALVTGKDRGNTRKLAAGAGTVAVGVLTVAKDDKAEHFTAAGKELPKLAAKIQGNKASGMAGDLNMLDLTDEAIKKLSTVADDTKVEFNIPAEDEAPGHTWNAVGVLPGSDPLLAHAAILFSAHLDHLGVGKPVNGDSIYNGADDDASGTVAVLELARVLGSGDKPKRTVIFALFGSEELGGFGATYFHQHSPVPLADIAANLEFEMIGRGDAAVKSDTLWLTGWERSNLGPTLAEHGARLVADPHPKENFFARSDNYVLAKQGVVAQTISSFGLHADYHQPSDDVAHIDFKHMDAAIGSLLKPVEWLVNSDFKPEWKPGGKP